MIKIIFNRILQTIQLILSTLNTAFNYVQEGLDKSGNTLMFVIFDIHIHIAKCWTVYMHIKKETGLWIRCRIYPNAVVISLMSFFLLLLLAVVFNIDIFRFHRSNMWSVLHCANVFSSTCENINNSYEMWIHMDFICSRITFFYWSHTHYWPKFWTHFCIWGHLIKLIFPKYFEKKIGFFLNWDSKY